jgi:hypothetical protein
LFEVEGMARHLVTGLISATLLAGPVGSADVRPQSLQSQLDATVATYSLAAGSLVEALHKLATDFHLPMGVEWVRDADSLKPVTLSWHGARVSDVIARLVAAYPHYRLSTEGSAVHVFHADVRNTFSDALSVRLGPIEIKDEALAAASGFRVLPRVRRVLQPAPPRWGGVGGSIASGPGGDRRVRVEGANPTLREVLDMLAVSAEEVMWVVTYPPRGPYEGRWMPTVTMGGQPVSPEHQPLWTFVPWGPDGSVFFQENRRIH